MGKESGALPMKILALEFSSPIRSVAIAAEGQVRGQVAEQCGRETHAFALIASALRQARVARNEIDCVAVGLGPGSYAGIRIAIAIAQGWQAADGTRLLGISSAEVVAAQAAHLGRSEVLVIHDSGKQQLFGARYEVSIMDRPRLMEPFRLLTAAECAQADQTGLAFRMDVLPEMQTPGGCPLYPRADGLARVALQSNSYVTAERLEAIYVRNAEFVKALPPRFVGV